MPNVIKPKRSYTASTVPTGLVAGEIAVNVADGKVWMCNAAGTANILVSSLAFADHTGTPPAAAITSIVENLQTVSVNKSLTALTNGFSVGPITIDTGITVTVGSNQRYLVF